MTAIVERELEEFEVVSPSKEATKKYFVKLRFMEGTKLVKEGRILELNWVCVCCFLCKNGTLRYMISISEGMKGTIMSISFTGPSPGVSGVRCISWDDPTETSDNEFYFSRDPSTNQMAILHQAEGRTCSIEILEVKEKI